MAFCTRCGNPIIDGDSFCTRCGTPVRVNRNETPDNQEISNTAGVTASEETVVIEKIKAEDDSGEALPTVSSEETVVIDKVELEPVATPSDETVVIDKIENEVAFTPSDKTVVIDKIEADAPTAASDETVVIDKVVLSDDLPAEETMVISNDEVVAEEAPSASEDNSSDAGEIPDEDDIENETSDGEEITSPVQPDIPVSAPMSTVEISDIDAVFCPKCGAILQSESRFCTRCGAPVEAQNTDPSSAETVMISPVNGENAAAPAENAASKTAIDEGISELIDALPSGSSPYSVTSGVDTFVTAHAVMGADDEPAVTVGKASMPVAAPAPAAQPEVVQPISSAQQTYSAPAQEPRKSRWPLIVIILSLVVIVAAILVAVWWFVLRSTVTYEVSFDTGEGTPIAEVVLDQGDALSAPDDPTREGYTFEGWYSDPGFTELVHFPLDVDADTKLYAKWQEAAADETSDQTEAEDEEQSSDQAKEESKEEESKEKESENKKSEASSDVDVVTFSFEGKDGTVKEVSIRRVGDTERVIPNSNTERLTKKDIDTLTDAEKCIAWNEIVASNNGYAFKNSGLRSYFESCSWYTPNTEASSSGDLDETMQANVTLLQENTAEWWRHLAAH